MTTTRGRADWRGAGACAQADPDLFFPISSTGRAVQQIAKAKTICAGCPVRQACLEFALEHDLAHGIWGGTTPEDRQAWRRRRRPGRLGAETRQASLKPRADVGRSARPLTVIAADVHHEGPAGLQPCGKTAGTPSSQPSRHDEASWPSGSMDRGDQQRERGGGRGDGPPARQSRTAPSAAASG